MTMAGKDNWINVGKGKRTLQCFYCYKAFVAFSALIEHLKSHESAQFLGFQGCNQRKKYEKKSELDRSPKHTCGLLKLKWQTVTRDSLAKACYHVFDLPEESFFSGM